MSASFGLLFTAALALLGSSAVVGQYTPCNLHKGVSVTSDGYPTDTKVCCESGLDFLVCREDTECHLCHSGPASDACCVSTEDCSENYQVCCIGATSGGTKFKCMDARSCDNLKEEASTHEHSCILDSRKDAFNYGSSCDDTWDTCCQNGSGDYRCVSSCGACGAGVTSDNCCIDALGSSVGNCSADNKKCCYDGISTFTCQKDC
eukprot:CAMPEP_0183309066 /NCGR_PEP_ID=MMETSP0160_2-20130417/23760_1 /TAXON_ID=2839 ORGANISM="Odontella Sinensis, Strain Grunow 1884" /NCGR_SAMPLE_ID=MMETSP0160_2 /ASSEMBLY_ACC=CAM_ASM_000250 /LENGTH=204 /DNA_ID=CAMNT_0025473015 /DNA_START=60 /DNA_END=674 /DNA_ORIENTATION=-